ncbi:Protein ABHD18 [Linum perenne]
MVTVNIGMLHYVIDHIYGAVMHRTKMSTPFFSKGWGGTKLALLERMVNDLFPEVEGQNWPPSSIQPIWRTMWESRNACLREGVFRTPCDEQLLSALPPECRTARVAFLAPKSGSPQKMACVVHLAGTGDHTYERRLRLAGPLLKDNIATMVLESPFYGQRRPMLQQGSKLLCDDGYVPNYSALELQKAWPGSEVRWVKGGHVSSFILHNSEFRRAIKDGLDRLEWKESTLC